MQVPGGACPLVGQHQLLLSLRSAVQLGHGVLESLERVIALGDGLLVAPSALFIGGQGSPEHDSDHEQDEHRCRISQADHQAHRTWSHHQMYNDGAQTLEHSQDQRRAHPAVQDHESEGHQEHGDHEAGFGDPADHEHGHHSENGEEGDSGSGTAGAHAPAQQPQQGDDNGLHGMEIPGVPTVCSPVLAAVQSKAIVMHCRGQHAQHSHDLQGTQQPTDRQGTFPAHGCGTGIAQGHAPTVWSGVGLRPMTVVTRYACSVARRRRLMRRTPLWRAAAGGRRPRVLRHHHRGG